MGQAIVAQAADKQISDYGQRLLDILESIDDEGLWQPGPGGSNSIGTLARHLTGNLRHFLGAGVLHDGYERDRPREFSEKNLPGRVVAADLLKALGVAREALRSIDSAAVTKPHTTPTGEEFATLGHLTLHLAAHFAYHVGQANYAARALQ